ncbi:MAG: glycosyltransferase family 39 protein [Candidatus Micrarchaeota archaeon]|nr:glycosyltransferase family 39 protein [Candidatus Micrarchaeota archaeon]
MAFGTDLYLLTIGILIAFVGTIASFALARKSVSHAIRESNLMRRHILWLAVALLVFFVVEGFVVQPAQQLFFDDAIYQGGAQSMLNSGQAWMCDFGSPAQCFVGEIFHEPIGTSFNLAIAFLVAGVKLAATYNTMFVLGGVSVLFTFLAVAVLFRNPKVAFLSALMLALSPMVLIWARPTTSDIPTLAYSMVALFAMAVFIRRKSVFTLSAFAFSLALVSYMKVFALIYIPIILVMYLILDDKSVRGSIRENLRLLRKHALDTNVLIVLLLFVVAIAPEISYAYTQATTGNYGGAGTSLQNTCAGNTLVPVAQNIGLSNLADNICSSTLFWFDYYAGAQVVQPLLYTGLAVAGAACMFVFRFRRELLAIGLWFLAFFIFYASFYAGSPTYGVDWRFQLSMAAQASILAGFALFIIFDALSTALLAVAKKAKFTAAVSGIVVFLLIAYPVYAYLPVVGVSPAGINQAPDARFYEGFVYNYSSMIPANCLVYTYDPTLFNINNRSAEQMGDLFNSQVYENRSTQYSCAVLDWGYWCYTPNNYCAYAKQNYVLQPIKNATFQPGDKLFGFYRIVGRK